MNEGAAPDRAWTPRRVTGLPHGLVLFDGVCVFCSRWVRFVIDRDPAGEFRFIPIQCEPGRRLAVELGIDPDDPQSNAVVIGTFALFKADAALAVLERLPGYRWSRLLRIAPRALRDRVYDRIARNRYRIFGRTEACIVPGPELAPRFLDRLPTV